MNAKYWQKGETLDYTPTEAVKNGAVVSLGTRIGIAGSDIAANEQGQIHVVGVFEMAKDGAEIALGAAVYYTRPTTRSPQPPTAPCLLATLCRLPRQRTPLCWSSCWVNSAEVRTWKG